MTSQQLQMNLFDQSEVWTLSAEDFRVKLSQLRENDEVSKILEELYFLKSQGSQIYSDLVIYSLKTSKDSSVTGGGDTFETILGTLDGLGYDVEWNVLNSKEYVPQNRERVFIIGHLRGKSTRQVFPFERDDRKAGQATPAVVATGKDIAYNLNARYEAGPRVDKKMHTVVSVGNSNPSEKGMNGEVYSNEGLSPTLTTNKGEGNKIAIPVLTPDRVEKRQNGRRFKEDGEEMFTLTAQDRHGVMQVGNVIETDSFGGNPHRGRVYDPEGLSPCLNCMGGGGLEPKILQKPRGNNSGGTHEIAPTVTSNSYESNNLLDVGGIYTNDSERFNRGTLPGLSRTLKANKADAGILIREATSKGYSEATPGDSVNIAHPNSKIRRGRVGKQIANTLLTGEEQAVVTQEYRIRKLTPRECWRLQGFPDWAFDKAAKVNSNSQLYKQAGNSVTVPVIYDIARRL